MEDLCLGHWPGVRYHQGGLESKLSQNDVERELSQAFVGIKHRSRPCDLTPVVRSQGIHWAYFLCRFRRAMMMPPAVVMRAAATISDMVLSLT
jgi:hypothetical protein